MSADQTVPATPRRREQARRRGMLPTSDGVAWIASTIVLMACLPMWLRSVAGTLSDQLDGLTRTLADPQAPFAAAAMRLAWQLVLPTATVLLAATAAGLGVRLLLDRPGLVPARLAAFERMHPGHGLRRLASRETAGRLLTGLLAAAILAVAMRWAFADVAADLRSGLLDPREPAEGSLWLAWQGLWSVLAAAGTVAIIQHVLRWRASERRLRMTPEELREEQRLLEANPRIRLPTHDAPEPHG